MFVTFTTFAVGGPALIYWVSPTEEELFKKYNPELQKRSLENRIGKQQDFDDFVGRLKVLSRSDKPSMFFLLGLWFGGMGRWGWGWERNEVGTGVWGLR